MTGNVLVQKKLSLQVETPLGKEALILMDMEGVESLSTPFYFNLRMYSSSPNLNASHILGKSSTIVIRHERKVRYINGVIGEFVQGPTIGHPLVKESRRHLEEAEVTLYYAKLYPLFWLAQFNGDCRIFQNEDTLKIIKKVLSEYKVTPLKDATHRQGRKVREYCVQYNESAFAFVSRLLESEGIFYFFEHENGKHTLIIGDEPSAHPNIKEGNKISYVNSEFTAVPFDVVFNCDIINSTVLGGFASTDFNYTTPKTSLLAQSKGHGIGGIHFEYPGHYQQHSVGEGVTNIRLQAYESSQKILKGKSTVPFFSAGHKFHLVDHNAREVNGEYVLQTVRHRAQYDVEKETFLYENEFEAFPSKTHYRPPLRTPHPRIYGSQTAIVTGKKEEEIYTDNYSRIKVKFHWDRHGKNDETSSCWIRVATAWAGTHWGTLYTPRIGQEVVISFLNGDPDKPLVTGSVYNADHMPPYRPSEATKATMKSNTSKGGKGFNELRFEDKKDKEEIWIHAQKDMNIDIINDRNTKIEKGNCKTIIEAGDRDVTLEGKEVKDENPGGPAKRGNDNLTIKKGSRTVKIQGQGSGKGNHTLEITKGDKTVTITKGDEKTTLDKGNRSVKLAMGDESHEINGNYTRKVTKNYTLEVVGNLTIKATGNITIESAKSISEKAGMNFSEEAGMNFNAKAGMNFTIKAGMGLTAEGGMNTNIKAGAMMSLKAGAMGSYEAGAILSLKGAMVKIN